MKTATATKHYYADLNGAVYCTEHLGAVASGEVERNPNVKKFDTSMTSWFRMSKFEISSLSDLVIGEFGYSDICQECRG